MVKHSRVRQAIAAAERVAQDCFNQAIALIDECSVLSRCYDSDPMQPFRSPRLRLPLECLETATARKNHGGALARDNRIQVNDLPLGGHSFVVQIRAESGPFGRVHG